MKKLISVILILAIILSLFSGCNAGTSVNSYDIFVQFDEETKTLQSDMAVTFFNTSKNEIDELQFNMFANAYRQNAKLKAVPDSKFTAAYLHGKSYGYIDIQKVVDKDGKQLEFSIGGLDKNLLVVKLPKPLKPNDKATVTVTFSVKLANVSHRLGYMDDVVFLGNFFPILAVYENGKYVECPYYAVGDPFYSSVANFNVTLKCPSSYVVGASGTPSKVLDGGDFTSTTYSIENARDFALTLSKNYRVIKGVVDGIELTYLYKKDASPNDSFMTASQAIRTFNKLFGKYPYPTLTVSETPFSDGGMEYPAHVFISDLLSKDERTEVVVHEIAHEWWYGVVGNNQLEFAVFDEGLAQYSTLMFFEDNSQYEITRTKRITALRENYANYVKLQNIANIKSSSPICKPLKDFPTQFEYVFKTYVLGEIFFDDLRIVIGDTKFNKALANLYRQYKFKEITLTQFAQSISNSTNIDVESYIQSYLN